MFSFLSFLIKLILNIPASKKNLIIKIALLEKELEIYRRQNKNNRIKLNQSDRIIVAILNQLANLRNHISIVKPETVLKWQNELIKSF